MDKNTKIRNRLKLVPVYSANVFISANTFQTHLISPMNYLTIKQGENVGPNSCISGDDIRGGNDVLPHRKTAHRMHV